MKKLILLFIIVEIAFYSCDNKKADPNLYFNFHDTLILPFDTAKVLAMMNVVDSVNEVSNYIGENDSTLFQKIDTLDLNWIGPTDDYADWRYADSTDRVFISKHRDFFIEPADEKLKIPDCMMMFTRIQFIGREYVRKSFPKGFFAYGHYPIAGRVFKYYAYKIYKPFSVYGPNIKTNDINGFEMTQLKVK